MSKIYASLSKAQAAIRGAVKENTNPHFKSRYADLESVIDAIRKPLADNELSFVQSVSDGHLHTVIYHADGGNIVSLVPFVGQMPDMQKVGSALTYARRQGLCTAFGVPQVDDDGNEAAYQKPVVKQTATKPVAPATPVAPVAKKEEIPAGLLTDGPLPEEKNITPCEPFKATPKTDNIKLDLERYGLEVKVETIYPLFVDGRDNELVKSIMASEKIPMTKLAKHGAALKKFCAETRDYHTLSDAVVAFFMENK